MDNKTNSFQIILVGAFAFFIVVGVIVFSTVRSGSEVIFPEVTIWGTAPKRSFDVAYGALNLQRTKKEGQLNVTYVEKRKGEFESDLIEALASGKGPDAVILPEDFIVKHADKIYPVSFESLSLRDYKDLYADAAEIFLVEKGSLGFPLYADPLVMYWNKDIFASEGIAEPPRYWTEFFTLSESLSRKDSVGNITRSAVALGEFSNVRNAKGILSALFFQAGTPIVEEVGGEYRSVLNKGRQGGVDPAQSVIAFFTDFSNPNKASYSWNRSLPESQQRFIAGDLAVYFGYASELAEIRLKNPNLNFDVAVFPQLQDAKVNVTSARVYSLAILKSSSDISGTFSTLVVLAGKDFASMFSENAALPPLRRDLLRDKPDDPDLSIFYDSAIISKSWLDPDGLRTNAVFENMVEDVSAGRSKISDAVLRASQEIGAMLQN
ncbi:MAG: hypothetical protein A3G52_00265 [Candidatus Taylorbacteria bacterium RIFCSPLOWO2_12_FULL_43_20]|uniref:Sugar ABC transporter substrate-binding protein n=1 Tax=Candidatus Taylorbacteria bacterium RIFCSPLOWO2_12_FULL_43_20 TaxID=1802332 RepID=A0A1G2P1F4_9BACT|nr:MAG: hypothetical protein A2825_01660 [Candidatus Taylorbacteria bacterium RIFCSPHIGHO2_01_FULL_43_120]OHA23100.1 MAG: hypothetical protein A3B98_03545 [Candidatus Taylorbacteria bacterium RIFCSPHIGHO2_02_FULL_43_55]OHA28919.1 MAG: hypothetical protein A3E92_04585 [Candidatus Taylorbacteria bacterium RIFCSPHIGHO2_12_FULL_42_34]OHA30903.1 MAG: hypothetical protein A3B09_04535 [Candidatus Taylorbacteria bacterium RIFCSPLOWO2_01_FULL_43_83]OHA39303.1 MAG: hypothetical protein A3H58_03925 [Candi